MAEINIETTTVNSVIKNESFALSTVLIDPSDNVVSTGKDNYSAETGQTIRVTKKIPFKMPSLWSIDEPKLYIAKASLLLNNQVVDESSTRFGIRSIKINPQNGFPLNGKPV